jgi:hypothetical protein
VPLHPTSFVKRFLGKPLTVSDSEGKVASGTFYLQEVLHGGIINRSDIAIRVARILLESMYGKAKAERQDPLVAADKGDHWVVRGSYNLDRKLEGPGPFVISILKKDCRVIDAYAESVMHVDPRLRSVIGP